MVPLEPLKARYTESLTAWERRAFATAGFTTQEIYPDEPVDSSINVGEVLDAINRPKWAMRQTLKLLEMAPDIGKVWFSDFYHPGLDALAYSRSRFEAFSFCWAQTFDQYDFTRKVHLDWMRPWEVMALSTYSGVFVASELLADLIVTALPHAASKIFVVGLPFNSAHVFAQLPKLPTSRAIDVIYTSRFDEEKHPVLFLDLVERNPQWSFAVCTGHSELRGTDTESIQRAKALHAQGRLTIHTGCSKADYYSVLSSSKVQFNSARQDWVSFTLLEALTFGCIPCYPMTRSFTEVFAENPEYLYTPGSCPSAEARIERMLDGVMDPAVSNRILSFHNGTLGRIAEILKQ